MVVVPEPAVKCGAALGAVAVDRSIGPAAEHGADESLGLAIGMRPVGAGAEVMDTQRAAGHSMCEREVGATVIRHELLDLDPVTAIERPGAAQACHRGARLLVGKHLGVGEARAVIDGDVHTLPANHLATCAGAI